MIVDDEEMVTLPIQLVHELFQYIHPDLKYIIHRSNNSDKRLPLSIIMKSNLEDYFEDVLLSDRFKPLLTDACASYGQLDSLKWAHMKGCQWTKIDNRTALEKGHDMLKFFGTPKETVRLLCVREIEAFGEQDEDNFDLNWNVTYHFKGACALASYHGHLHILKWLRENDCPWNSNTCLAAVAAGHLHILKWSRENSCPWHSKICRTAAYEGHLHILQWLQDNHCGDSNFDCTTISAAARGGFLHIIQWLRGKGCDWDSESCSAAAKGGHLQILQWLRVNGCDWDMDTTRCAAGAGHLHILQWALENECELDEWTCTAAAEGGHLHILRWLRANGYGQEIFCMSEESIFEIENQLLEMEKG